MYYFLAILVGAIVSVMVAINGGLTQGYGIYLAAVIIHAVGVLFAFALCVARKEKIWFKSGVPIWFYLGGVMGVFSVMFSNYAFGRITMTSIAALGLLGQSLTSVLLDGFGWLGIEKRRINKNLMVGFLLALLGVFLMLDESVSVSMLAVVSSIGAGVTVVLSRTVNSRLAAQTSPLVGSFINHLVGLPICIVLALFLHGSLQLTIAGARPWAFLGGTLGVLTVLIFNVIVPKVSAFRITLLSFIGQIFTGIALDLAQGTGYSNSSFTGGLVIAAGLLINIALERWGVYKKQKDEKYWRDIRKAEDAHWEKLLGSKTTNT